MDLYQFILIYKEVIMAGSTYSRQEEARYTLQLNKMLDALPRFLVEYFNSLEFTKQPRTKIAYAYDLDTFFDFLVQNNRSHFMVWIKPS